jgi:hypothetical protein
MLGIGDKWRRIWGLSCWAAATWSVGWVLLGLLHV